MPGYLSSISIPMLMYKEQKIIVIKTVIHLDRNFVQKSFKSFHILFIIPIICDYRPVYGFVILIIRSVRILGNVFCHLQENQSLLQMLLVNYN